MQRTTINVRAPWKELFWKGTRDQNITLISRSTNTRSKWFDLIATGRSFIPFWIDEQGDDSASDLPFDGRMIWVHLSVGFNYGPLEKSSLEIWAEWGYGSTKHRFSRSIINTISVIDLLIHCGVVGDENSKHCAEKLLKAKLGKKSTHHSLAIRRIPFES